VRFRVVPDDFSPDTFLPRVRGVVQADEAGAIVRLRVRISRGELAFLSLVPFLTAAILSWWVPAAALLAPVVVIGEVFAYFVTFRPERKRVERLLREALEA
jgi:hypothetical protein